MVALAGVRAESGPWVTKAKYSGKQTGCEIVSYNNHLFTHREEQILADFETKQTLLNGQEWSRERTLTNTLLLVERN